MAASSNMQQVAVLEAILLLNCLYELDTELKTKLILPSNPRHAKAQFRATSMQHACNRQTIKLAK